MLTNKNVYEAKDSNGNIYGQIGLLDLYRFKKTLEHVPVDTESVLDCGCDRGQWLSYVCGRRSIKQHLGVDISEARISEAKLLHPELNLQVGYLENTVDLNHKYDVVTALEVLEHIPDWSPVLDSLFSWAKKRVIVSVPYKEQLSVYPCIHCGKPTPNSGHLHSFKEETFQEYPGWTKKHDIVNDHGILETSLPHKIYRLFRPRPVWLLTVYVKN